MRTPMPKKRKQPRTKREPPTKWTAPFVGYPVRDADGNIVEVEGMPKLTDEQKRAAIENAEYFRSIRPDDAD